MVANSLKVNEGAEVYVVVKMLEADYHVHSSVLRVASYGDCSNRERLFIVGFHKENVGSIGAEFKFPLAEFDDSHFFTAKDVAMPDEDVPERFWMYEDVEPFATYPEPRPLCIHKVGQIRPGMGPSWRPYAVQTHDGIYPCQTTHNGGGRRLPLGWRDGDSMGVARVTCPQEAVRIASLPDDYQSFVSAHDSSD